MYEFRFTYSAERYFKKIKEKGLKSAYHLPGGAEEMHACDANRSVTNVTDE